MDFDYRISPNPDRLTESEVLQLVCFCPICGTPWPKGKHVCANKACGVKVRAEPRALNWWMFYPRHNGWANSRE